MNLCESRNESKIHRKTDQDTLFTGYDLMNNSQAIYACDVTFEYTERNGLKIQKVVGQL